MATFREAIVGCRVQSRALYLGISNQNDLSVRALAIEVVDCGSGSSKTSLNRLGVAGASTRRLASTGGVVNGL